MPVELERTIGKYRILETLGSGGLATVYRARDPVREQTVALKVLHSYFAAEPALVGHFFQELVVVARMRHQNIVLVHEYGEADGYYWIAMDLQEGSNLREAVRSPQPLGLAVGIVAEVAQALEHAHQHGLLHCNMKPSNVFLTPQGGARLSDFAFAALGEGARASGNVALSTPMPSFMSPEQAAGRPLDVTSDVYSLGALLYWLLTGTAPFMGEDRSTVLAKQLSYPPTPPSERNPLLGHEVDQVVLKALAWTPPARYQRPGDLVTALIEAVHPTQPRIAEGLSSRPAMAPSTVEALQDLATRVVREEAPPLVTQAAVPALEVGECQRCGRANPPELRFCAFCGYTLLSPVPASVLWGRIWQRYVVRRSRIALLAAVASVTLALGVVGAVSYSSSRPPDLPPPTSTVSSASAPGAWSMFRHDPGRTGYAPSSSPSFKGELKWEFSTAAPISSSPAVASGMVYVPTGDGRIVALDAETGKLRWEYPITGSVDSSPALAEELLYVGLRDGRLLALDRQEGSLRWEFATGGPIFASPTVVEGVVYLGSFDNNLYALDAKTGELRWAFPTNGRITSSAAVEGGVAVFGNRDWWVYLVDTDTGRQRFSYPTFAQVEGAPVLRDSVVYVGGEGRRFIALDATQRDAFGYRTLYWLRSQAFLWGWASQPPPPKGLLWVARISGRLISSPALAEGRLFLGTDASIVYSLEAETGKKLWEFRTGGPIFSSASAAGSTLYIGSDDGKLYALDMETGEKQWEFTTQGHVRSSPAITADGLYFTSDDGKIYALH